MHLESHMACAGVLEKPSPLRKGTTTTQVAVATTGGGSDKDSAMCGTLQAGSSVGHIHHSDFTETGSSTTVRLHAENRQLKAQLAEAISSNKMWLAYDSKRDELMNNVLRKNKALQAERTMCTCRDDPGHSATGDIHTRTMKDNETGQSDSEIVLQYKRKSEEEEQERRRLETIIHRQQQYIQRLQAALEDSHKTLEEQQSHKTPSTKRPTTNAKRSSLPEDLEQIELLKNQVEVFSEDFHQERRDRERAQTRVHELEEQMELLTRQLTQFQQSHMSQLAERRRSTMDAYRDEYQRQVALQQREQACNDQIKRYSLPSYNNTRLIPHGSLTSDLSQDGVEEDGDDDDDDDEDIVDVPMAQSASSPTGSNNSLECPRCRELFPAEDPLAFLDHNDACNA